MAWTSAPRREALPGKRQTIPAPPCWGRKKLELMGWGHLALVVWGQEELAETACYPSHRLMPGQGPKAGHLSGLGDNCAHPTPAPHCGAARNLSRTTRLDRTRTAGPRRRTPATRCTAPAQDASPPQARTPPWPRAAHHGQPTVGHRTRDTLPTGPGQPQPEEKPQARGHGEPVRPSRAGVRQPHPEKRTLAYIQVRDSLRTVNAGFSNNWRYVAVWPQ
jgi:hypothetical protein